MRQLPRLTSFIRVMSDGALDENVPGHSDNELQERRHSHLYQKPPSGLTWQKIIELVQKNTKDDHSVEEALQQLQKSSQRICGKDTSQDVLDDTKAFLLEVFYDSSVVGKKETSLLRRTFGPFPASAASTACTAVRGIVGCLTERDLEVLIGISRGRADGAASMQEFGNNIQFSQRSAGVREEDVSSSDSDQDHDEREIDMKYKEDTSECRTLPDEDSLWLHNEVAKYFPSEETVLGISQTELCSTIFDFLTSGKTDEELQNDLFELLGFDRFQLIQSLLEHRQDVVSITYDRATSVMLKKAARQRNDYQARPAYGCQVTIQSENEKQLKKQFRREEKRMSKLEDKNSDRETQYLKSIGFNPQELRAQREASLLAAASAPLFSSRHRYTEREKYPFVFDQLEEVKQSSAFVSGTKIIPSETRPLSTVTSATTLSIIG